MPGPKNTKLTLGLTYMNDGKMVVAPMEYGIELSNGREQSKIRRLLTGVRAYS